MDEEPPISPKLALFISIVAVSTASILIRMSTAPPLIIAFYRMLFSTILLFPFFMRSNRINRVREQGQRGLLNLMGVGVVLAIHFATWITSLSLTSVASSVIFVHVDPIFVAIVSHFLFKERITRRTLIGIIIAFAGATIIAIGDMGIGEMSFIGDMLALVGAVMLGLYILAGRRIRQGLDLVSYVTPVYATSALVLGVMLLATGTSLTGYASNEYLLFLVIAVVPMIFGHTVYNWTLKYLTAPVVSISLLGEPVGASILAYIFLNESPTFLILVGGAVTLAGILLCVFKPDDTETTH
jgi:drug/metabolite transporter (DMT)-like permease